MTKPPAEGFFLCRELFLSLLTAALWLRAEEGDSDLSARG